MRTKTFINIKSNTNTLENDEGSVNEVGQLVYGFLHLLGAANACSNPILYGLLNENFLVQYKRLYRWLPGYYGNRARRYSIPGCQRYALNCNLERQNAFRVHRLSIIPSSHNGCQSMDTTEENFMEVKASSGSNEKEEMAPNAIQPNTNGLEGNKINIDHENKISNGFQNQEWIKNEKTKCFQNTKNTPFHYVLMEKVPFKGTALESKMSSKNLVSPAYQSKENTKEDTKKITVADNNLEMAITNLEALRNKRKQLSKSSFSLDDGDKEITFSGTSTSMLTFNDEGRKEKENGNQKPDNNEHSDSSKICRSCGEKNEVNSTLFFVSHNPKSPVYSLLTSKNKIKYIENIRKLDTDIDSAYEDDYYSPCPTTTDSVATKTFDFDDLEMNDASISNKQTFNQTIEHQDERGGTPQLSMNSRAHQPKFSHNFTIDPSSTNNMNRNEIKDCTCKTFDQLRDKNILNGSIMTEVHMSVQGQEKDNSVENICDITDGISNTKSKGISFLKGRTQFSFNRAKNSTTERNSGMLFSILEPPRPKKIEKRKDYLLNELSIQNETYV